MDAFKFDISGMKYKIVALIVLMFIGGQLVAQKTLSKNSQISLLTCAPGEELYSVFGHSAIRIVDNENQIDWVYNYGTFDFNTPNFYLKFANGNLNYMLTVSQFKYFLYTYVVEERSVVEQVLNLNQIEKQRIFDVLNQNALPENREYRYDFFFDNCATRLRDQVFNNISGSIRLQNEEGHQMSYRQLYGSYLEHSPWIEFGIHLLLGMKSDKIATAFSEMYLPDYLYAQFEKAKIQHPDSSINLVISEIELLNYPRPTAEISKFYWPSSVFVILFFMVLIGSFINIRTKKGLNIFDAILFISVGSAGLLFGFLWFFTKHSVTGENLNLLWAFPTILLVPISHLFRKKLMWLYKSLVWISLIFNALFILLSPLNLQIFPDGLNYLVGIILIRSIVILLSVHPNALTNIKNSMTNREKLKVND
jgi:hypothetical protein